MEYVKLDEFSVILVGVIVTLLSVVIILSLFVHVSSTESGSIAEFIVTEQTISCISPMTLSLGWNEILGIGTTNNYKTNEHNIYHQCIYILILHSYSSQEMFERFILTKFHMNLVTRLVSDS